MQRLLFITLFMVFVSSFCFSVELKGKTVGQEDITFVSKVSGYKSNPIELYKSGSAAAKLAKYEKTWLYLAIGFTIGTAATFTMGIAGSALFGFAWYSTNWLLYPAAYALMGLGWGFFSLCLHAMVAFWILYAISTSGRRARIKKKIQNMPVVVELAPTAIGLTVKL